MTDLENVEFLLRALQSNAESLSGVDLAIARERAIKALRGKVGAPARMVDAALKPKRNHDGSATGQGRLLALADPEPWPKPVEGVQLLDSLARIFGQYLSLPRGAATAMALWVAMTHAFESFFILPLLAITSPEKRCGKSTLLTILFQLVPRPLLASNITPAALFRVIEAMRPTLLIDEADSFMKRSDELRGVINCGHTRATACVVRTVGDDHEPRLFNVFAPKAIALIGRLPDTIEDRSIRIQMKRRSPGEDLERLRLDRVEHLAELSRKAARWARDQKEDLASVDPKTPPELNDRARDNWRSLLAMAELAGGPWPGKGREAALMLSGNGNEEDSIRTQLLADIRVAFEDRTDTSIFTEDLLAILHQDEDKPWGERRNGKAISGHGLARLLKPFGVRPKEIRIGSETKRGYTVEDFEDVFNRYLVPPTAPVEVKQPKLPNGAGGCPQIVERNDVAKRFGSESPENPCSSSTVLGVSVQDGDRTEGPTPLVPECRACARLQADRPGDSKAYCADHYVPTVNDEDEGEPEGELLF